MIAKARKTTLKVTETLNFTNTPAERLIHRMREKDDDHLFQR
jgi:hypothetical protein